MKPLPNPLMRRILLSMLFSGLAIVTVHAQLKFSFSTTTAIYTANSGGTTIISSGVDDGLSAVTSIGFNFTYGCNTYTQFRVSSNGWLSLGYNTLSSMPGNSLSVTGQGPILAPLWDDLATSDYGNINYILSGSAPNRVLTIEWLNMLWDANGSDATISFQVKLYETSNVIDFTYSREWGAVNNGSGGASIGLNGGYSTTDFYSLDGSGTAPTANYGMETNNISTRPATNRVYRWTPGSMTYSSCTTTQASTAVVSKCNNLNQVILGMQVVTSGCVSPATVTQFQVNMTGSTAPVTDVTAVHIYYTGNSAGFAPANEFFSGGSASSAGTITVNGSQALLAGTNYFWIAYDVKSTATTSDLLDAQCTQITVGGTARTPLVTNPAGTRQVVNCSIAPGGVAGASFWIKADAGTSTTTDGGVLSAWNDQSGNARNAAAPSSANSPTYYNNSTRNINFNPVVNFNYASQTAASASYMNIASNGILSTGNNPYEVYAVVAPGTGNSSGTAGKFLFAGSGINGFNAFDVRSGNSFNDSWDLNDLIAGSVWTSNYPSLASFDYNSTQRTMFVSGAVAGTKVNNNHVATDVNNALGCQVIPGGTNAEFYDGSIAEIITYANASHGQATRNQVESYLAIKYGITLQHDYVTSNGSTVWSRSLNTNYNNNIIGIARDDIGALSQKQSKSTSVTPDMLTMYIGAVRQVNQAAGTGTFAGGDRSFFLAGSNGAPILFAPNMTTDLPVGICCRLQRAWLSQKMNFTNTDLTLQFDFNNVAPGYTPLFASDLRLLVDDDGVFTNATILNTPVISISVASSVVTVVVPAASIPSNKPYFTLASAAIRTPLPVTIKSFSASCHEGKVWVTWEAGSTGSYAFTVERSSGGAVFVPVGEVPADVTGRTVYTWVDASPLPGGAAYRLKATGSGSIAAVYSPVVPVTDCGGEGAVSVTTDPVTGRSRVVLLRLQQDAVVDIAFYDLLGRRIGMPGLTGRRSMGQGVYYLPIPGQGLASGMYLLSVVMGDKRSIVRIIQ